MLLLCLFCSSNFIINYFCNGADRYEHAATTRYIFFSALPHILHWLSILLVTFWSLPLCRLNVFVSISCSCTANKSPSRGDGNLPFFSQMLVVFTSVLSFSHVFLHSFHNSAHSTVGMYVVCMYVFGLGQRGEWSSFLATLLSEL